MLLTGNTVEIPLTFEGLLSKALYFKVPNSKWIEPDFGILMDWLKDRGWNDPEWIKQYFPNSYSQDQYCFWWDNSNPIGMEANRVDTRVFQKLSPTIKGIPPIEEFSAGYRNPAEAYWDLLMSTYEMRKAP